MSTPTSEQRPTDGRDVDTGTATGGATFLSTPADTPDLQRVVDADVEQQGFVMNASRAWGHQPALKLGLFDLLGDAARAAGLSFRQRGILVAATAATIGDSYCSLAWGNRLAGEAGADVAAGVLRGDDTLLDPAERTLAAWARRVATDPNGTSPGDITALRAAGLDDASIVAVTTFVALRIAFSTVNGSLGARPDAQLADAAPPPVRDIVTYGRPPAVTPSGGRIAPLDVGVGRTLQSAACDVSLPPVQTCC